MATLPAAVVKLLNASFASIGATELAALRTLVANSPTLTAQLAKFAAAGGTISLTTGVASGSFTGSTIALAIPSPMPTVQSVTNPFAALQGEPATGSYDTVSGQLVGALSHEIGHYMNSAGPLYTMTVKNPIYAVPLPPFTGLNQPMLAADEFLGEGLAIYNNEKVAAEIAGATNGASQIKFASGLGAAANLAFEEQLAGDPVATAVTAAANQVVVTIPGGESGTYLQKYWTAFAPKSGAKLNENITNVVSAAIQTNTSGTAIGMTLHHNDPVSKAYDSIIDFSSPTVTTDKIVSNSTGLFQFEILNPQKFTGTVTGFTTGDVIDLLGIGTAKSATLGTDNVLAVTQANGTVLSLHLPTAQSYAGQSFVVAPDGRGGTNITLKPAAAVGRQVSSSGTVTIGTAQEVAGTEYGLWWQNVAVTVITAGFVYGVSDVGIEIEDDGNVTNTGLIEGASGVIIGRVGTVANSGEIVGTNGVALGIGDGGNVTNNAGGAVEGTTGGVVITGATGQILNSGSITASSGEAVELAAGGTVSNSGAAALIDGLAYGVWMPDGPGTVTNQGTIIGTNDFGIEIGGAANITNSRLVAGANGIETGGAGTLANTGTITATNGTGVTFGDGGSVTNGAGKSVSGTVGGVVITSATGVVANAGSITASSGEAVELASGGTVSNTGAATLLKGLAYGVWMPDGPGVVSNKGTIIGTNDFGIEIGGAGRITNTLLVQGANGIGTGGAGTLTNAGTITATNGTGVTFGNGGTVSNAAGETIGGTVGGVVITSASGIVVNAGTVSASSGEAVELASGGTVNNTGAATLITGRAYGVWMPDGPGTVSNKGTIIGTNDFGIEIGGTGSIANSLLITGANGIETGGVGTLANTGMITATNGTGVTFGNGGSVTNAAGRTIGGTVGGVVITSATGTVVNAGSITASSGAAVELAAGGAVGNNAASTLLRGLAYGVWMPDGPGTVNNNGTIIGTNDFGIEIGGKGKITNTLLVAGANGIETGGAGTLTNAGTITATNGTGVTFGGGGSVTNAAGKAIGGTVGGVVITTVAGAVSNAGTITASSGAAVELASGGNVGNTGGSALITGKAYGVWMPDGAGTVTNQGTIIGTNDFGIEIGGKGASVLNSGTIEGATGVSFGGTGGTLTTSGDIIGTGGVAVDLGTGNQLVVEPGATFTGKVLDPAASDTLELGGSTPATLGGVGTSIAGFGPVLVDAGASWTLPGSSDIDSLRLAGALTVASAGSLDVATIDATSVGMITLAHGAALEIGAASPTRTVIAFLGGNTLTIDHAALFGTGIGTSAYAGPLLHDFATGDAIDLPDVAAAGLRADYSAATGLLTLTGPGSQVASLAFDPSQRGPGAFRLGGDGHGGTLLTLG